MTIHILSTSLVDLQLVVEARAKDVELDAMSFIEVSKINNPELAEEIAELCTLPVTAVFTSANAVKAIESIIEETKPQWTIYCIANATKNEVVKYFDPALIKGTANDAAALAEIIKAHNTLEVVFFCGDNRMD